MRAGAGLDASASPWVALGSSGSDRSETITIVIRSRWKQKQKQNRSFSARARHVRYHRRSKPLLGPRELPDQRQVPRREG